MSFEIPAGLTAMLQDFTVAVLRNKPPDLYKFAAEHFGRLYAEKAGVAAAAGARASPDADPQRQESPRRGKEMRFESPDSKKSEASSASPSPGICCQPVSQSVASRGGSRPKYWGMAPPLPSLPPHLPFPFFLPPLPLAYLSPPLFPSLPLDVGPRCIQLGSLGERCKLPERGLGRITSGNRILCILALKSGIWWHQIY